MSLSGCWTLPDPGQGSEYPACCLADSSPAPVGEVSLWSQGVRWQAATWQQRFLSSFSGTGCLQLDQQVLLRILYINVLLLAYFLL